MACSGSGTSVNGKLYFVANFSCAARLIGRNADDHGIVLGKGLRGVAEFASLLGAAGRIRLWIEEQNHSLPALLGELKCRRFNVGSLVASLDCHEPNCKLSRETKIDFIKDSRKGFAMGKGFAMKKLLLAVGCWGCLLAIGLPMTAAAGDAKKGKMVFAENCAMCHNCGFHGSEGWPGLEGPVQAREAGNGKPVNEANVLKCDHQRRRQRCLRFGDASSRPRKDNVIAYLKTL